MPTPPFSRAFDRLGQFNTEAEATRMFDGIVTELTAAFIVGEWSIAIYMNGAEMLYWPFKYEHMADLFWNNCVVALTAGVVTGIEPDWKQLQKEYDDEQERRLSVG